MHVEFERLDDDLEALAQRRMEVIPWTADAIAAPGAPLSPRRLRMLEFLANVNENESAPPVVEKQQQKPTMPTSAMNLESTAQWREATKTFSPGITDVCLLIPQTVTGPICVDGIPPSLTSLVMLSFAAKPTLVSVHNLGQTRLGRLILYRAEWDYAFPWQCVQFARIDSVWPLAHATIPINAETMLLPLSMSARLVFLDMKNRVSCDDGVLRGLAHLTVARAVHISAHVIQPTAPGDLTHLAYLATLSYDVPHTRVTLPPSLSSLVLHANCSSMLIKSTFHHVLQSKSLRHLFLDCSWERVAHQRPAWWAALWSTVEVAGVRVRESGFRHLPAPTRQSKRKTTAATTTTIRRKKRCPGVLQGGPPLDLHVVFDVSCPLSEGILSIAHFRHRVAGRVVTVWLEYHRYIAMDVLAMVWKALPYAKDVVIRMVIPGSKDPLNAVWQGMRPPSIPVGEWANFW